jgi:hypothetical protein
MYQRKYCFDDQQGLKNLLTFARLTWLVQTLLKVTKANVCASIVLARSFFASRSGITTRESKIWGRNANDSTRKPVSEGC